MRIIIGVENSFGVEVPKKPWTNVETFNSKDRIIDKKRPIKAGRQYQIIAKHSRSFGFFERIGRFVQGCFNGALWAITFGKVGDRKEINKLFTKENESRHFSIWVNNKVETKQ